MSGAIPILNRLNTICLASHILPTTRIPTMKRILTLALMLAAPLAHAAADYFVVVPSGPRLTQLPPAAGAGAENGISVTLLPFASPVNNLPMATVGRSYNFDFNSLLSVLGDPVFNATQVAWTVESGSLPTGLSLQANGTLAGTPSVLDDAGAAFEIQARYKGHDGRQVYTLLVGGAVLHAVQVSSGFDHTCAVTTSGGLKCWGRNIFGALGDGTTESSATPVDVVGLTSGVKEVSVGRLHTCAVTTAGAAKCWGWNMFRQLGTGDDVNVQVPTEVVGLTSGVSAIATGDYHSCALHSSGKVSCWGWGPAGELGNGMSALTHGAEGREYHPVPVEVLALNNAVAIAIGSNTCALTSAGGVKCWGNSTFFDPAANAPHPETPSESIPVDVAGVTEGVTQFSMGGQSACARMATGRVKCWGFAGPDNELSIGVAAPTAVPVEVPGLTDVAHVSVGLSHACARHTTGHLSCWGGTHYNPPNSSGELGQGHANPLTGIHIVPGLTNVQHVSAGDGYTCAVLQNGTTKCWGSNDFQQLGILEGAGSQYSPQDVQP